MSVELLERPPAEASEERAAPGADETKVAGASHAPGADLLVEEDDAQAGYAMKFQRRRKATKPSADAVRRAERRRRLQARGRHGRLFSIGLRVGLPGLVVVVAALVLGGKAEPPVPLPPELPASRFEGILALDRTTRVGTLFQARLRDAPEPSHVEEFRSRVEGIVGILSSEGYESLLLLAPDGATVVSGPVDAYVIGPLGVRGT